MMRALHFKGNTFLAGQIDHSIPAKPHPICKRERDAQTLAFKHTTNKQHPNNEKTVRSSKHRTYKWNTANTKQAWKSRTPLIS